MIISKSPLGGCICCACQILESAEKVCKMQSKSSCITMTCAQNCPVMGWDLWCYVGGADGSCQKNTDFMEFWQLSMTSYTLKVKRFTDLVWNMTIIGWSLACWWNTPSRHVFENSSMTRHSWISVESPRTGLDQGVDQTILIGYHH